MLKLKYLYENYDLAESVLENWEYDADTLDGYLRWFRISSNAVYPFLWQGNLRFLRLSPVSEKMENNLKGELEFLCYLQSRDYPAVVPVASGSGELVATVDSGRGKYYASVFKGVDGKQCGGMKGCQGSRRHFMCISDSGHVGVLLGLAVWNFSKDFLFYIY